jgi:hypothetical protein
MHFCAIHCPAQNLHFVERGVTAVQNGKARSGRRSVLCARNEMAAFAWTPLLPEATL